MPTGAFYPGLFIDKDPLDANDASDDLGADAGQIITLKDGTQLQYVKNGEASTALAAADFVYVSAAQTVKKSGAGQVGLAIAGVVFSTAITAGRYGWIKIRGIVTGQT